MMEHSAEDRLMKGIPILEVDMESPGKWVEADNGGRVWSGEISWYTRHGDAFVFHMLGQPNRVLGASLPDGTRVDAESFSPIDATRWRRKNPDGQGFLIGTIEIGADGVRFEDTGLVDEFEPRSPFEEAVAADADLRARLADEAFADAFALALQNTEYRMAATRDRYDCSWRYGGRMVAELRSVGESYIDFYMPPHAEETPALIEEVCAHLARLGWTVATDLEIDADHTDALAEIEKLEAKPSAWPEPWADGLHRFKDEDERAIARLVRLAKSGRVSEDDYRRIRSWIDWSRDAEMRGEVAPQKPAPGP